MVSVINHSQAMRRTSFPALASFWLALAIAPAPQILAADGPTPPPHQAGSIAGRVLNPATKEYLSSAEVRIQGTNLVAMTESDGSFRFPNVPAGTAIVSVTYTGTTSERVSVQ